MHPADDLYAEDAVRIAKSVLDGSTPIFVGKLLWKPLLKLFLNDKGPFVIISKVSGKLDEFPTANDRHLWNPEVVARKEAELAAWLPHIQEGVLEACREIVRRSDESDW